MPDALPLDVSTPISGAIGSSTYYEITVPAGVQQLSIVTSGGTGDVDIYFRWGALPTTSLWDYKHGLSGNDAHLFIESNFGVPTIGYLLLYGYDTYAGASLFATYVTGDSIAPPSFKWRSTFSNPGPTTTFNVPLNGGVVAAGDLLVVYSITSLNFAHPSFKPEDWIVLPAGWNHPMYTKSPMGLCNVMWKVAVGGETELVVTTSDAQGMMAVVECWGNVIKDLFWNYWIGVGSSLGYHTSTNSHFTANGGFSASTYHKLATAVRYADDTVPSAAPAGFTDLYTYQATRVISTAHKSRAPSGTGESIGPYTSPEDVWVTALTLIAGNGVLSEEEGEENGGGSGGEGGLDCTKIIPILVSDDILIPTLVGSSCGGGTAITFIDEDTETLDISYNPCPTCADE